MASSRAPILGLLCLFPIFAAAQIPYIPANTVEQTQTSAFFDTLETEPLANFRLHLPYSAPEAITLHLSDDFAVDLPGGGEHVVELTYEHVAGRSAIVSTTIDGEHVLEAHAIPGTQASARTRAGAEKFRSDDDALNLGQDFTAYVRFESTGNGTLFSKCIADGKWAPDAKALFLRGGRLVYDIGWLGDVSGGPQINDGEVQEVVARSEDGHFRLFLNGQQIAQKKDFISDDKPDHVFKIGSAAPDFAHDFSDGTIHNVRFWDRALEGDELDALTSGNLDEPNTPDLNWTPETDRSGTLAEVETFGGRGLAGIPTILRIEGEGFASEDAWVQPLETTDHAALISGWNAKTLEAGKTIYSTLCATCHGTPTQEGSIPVAIKFHEGEFKNGSDPFRMFQTLDQGYGMMVAQAQYTAAQKYAVIQYIRETFLKPHNPKQLFEINDDYLAALPHRLSSAEVEVATTPASGEKPFELMDFGSSLMWTYQVNSGADLTEANIAQKGIAIRLDHAATAAKVGISKGRAWMIYDHDTMRVAAAYTGEVGDFVDWRGIAFDGSHGSHTSIAGEPLFVNPNAPAWENPIDGGWDDQRIEGRDGRLFGPLPRSWVHYKGTYTHGDRTLIRYTVGEAMVLEEPGLIEYGAAPVFTRILNIGKSTHDLVTRVAPDSEHLRASLRAPKGNQVTLTRENGHLVLRIPAAATPLNLTLSVSAADQATLDSITPAPTDLEPLTQGGPARFGQEVITMAGEVGDEDGAFAVDTIPVPHLDQNPWNAWMRLGGFDFDPNNPDRAAVCTWLGDVWLVDGISGDLSEVRWRRICSGLFQPLGLKIVGGKIYVTCRDQIARLHDLNGDEEIDYVESFNNDSQVTEHFHEFAMGLQVDDDGNFYYAKSARHAKTALVPHHGTLLRVPPDGSRTDIVATGFRAANGVCLNPDGTWIVTDQEGHWNPKNRINYVREGGFYGNMFGYHDVEDSSDSAMEQPLCWITNAFDRSPAELLWVPEDGSWGALNGQLLNLSYGYGQVYIVPHEILPDGQAQGGMCALPIDNFPTGLHRGRFHPESHDLYALGMFAWAGSQQDDGGFFRIRATGHPAHLPTGIKATEGQIALTFSDDLPPGTTFEIKVWDLKRTASYGSKHYNERQLEITQTQITGPQATLTLPDLQPTWGMEIKAKLGEQGERVIHNSIHRLGE